MFDSSMVRRVGGLLGLCVLAFAIAGCCCSGALTPSCGCEAPVDPCGCEAPAEPVFDAPATVATAADVDVGPGERPAEARPGEAWCRVWIPAVSELKTETVMVEPAKRKKMWIPPEYGSRMKIVCVQPAEIKNINVAGVWDTRSREIMTCPERTVTERTRVTDECGCAQCVTNQRLIPARYGTIQERVCIAPPGERLKYTPAQYKCIEERYVIKPGFCTEVCEPARYETRTRTCVTQPGRWEWVRRSDCEVPEPEPVCEIPEPEPIQTLPALEVRMEDQMVDGSAGGIFRLGDEVRYELVVLSDTASGSMPDLKVVFELPEHLEFVSGGGNGLQVSGAGTAASTTNFSLGVGETRTLHVVARVRSVPKDNLVQVAASVRTAVGGQELAVETESTTLTDLN